MSVHNFLREFIEGSLFNDLETMQHAKPLDPTAQWGHLAYPIVMTCSAGIEVLGVLTSEEDPSRSKANFCHYWRTYLYPDPGPKREAAEAVYVLARCGITHSFAAKLPSVEKGTGRHLIHQNGVLIIDCLQLAEDFKRSYRDHIQPIALGTFAGTVTAETMNKQLKRLIVIGLKQIGEHQEAIERLDVVITDGRDAALEVPVTESLARASTDFPTKPSK